MKAVMAKVAFIAALVCISVMPARAWNCSDPLAERVLVPAGTIGTFGDGDGQLANFNGQLYECEVVSPTSQGGSNANQNSNSSNSTSGASANSGSTSTSNATGGSSSSKSVASGGTATGGSASISGSGNASLTNTNTATGGAGGSASQHQSQSTTSQANGNGVGNGNNSNNYSSVTNIPRQTATAVAPAVLPTVQCFKGFSGAAQGGLFGASFGGGKIDENCAILEASRLAPSPLAKCKVYISNKYVKRAGVSLDDCLEQIAVEQGPATVIPDVPVVAPQATPVPQPIIVNVPSPVVQILPIERAPESAPVPAPKVKPHVHKTPNPCATAPASKSSSVITNDDIDRMGPPTNKVCLTKG